MKKRDYFAGRIAHQLCLAGTASYGELLEACSGMNRGRFAEGFRLLVAKRTITPAALARGGRGTIWELNKGTNAS